MKQTLNRDNVKALLRDAGLDVGPLGLPEDKYGTIFFGEKVVAFRDKSGLYQRAEVCRFLSEWERN